jgi:hypothetical protein
MKRVAAALLTGVLLTLVVVGLVGLLSKADHRTDRNVPGATTGVGRSSFTDPDQSLSHRK